MSGGLEPLRVVCVGVYRWALELVTLDYVVGPGWRKRIKEWVESAAGVSRTAELSLSVHPLLHLRLAS